MKKSMITVLCLVVGIIAGFVMAVALGAAMSYIDPGTLLKEGHVKKFANIRIAVGDMKEDSGDGKSKMLLLTKDGIPFFAAHANQLDKVTEVCIVGKNNQVFFQMSSSERRGEWKKSIYSHDTNNITVGDQFIDIDFDGQFDAKQIYDCKGNRIESWINVNSNWIKVTSREGNGVLCGKERYIFTPDSGWEYIKKIPQGSNF